MGSKKRQVLFFIFAGVFAVLLVARERILFKLTQGRPFPNMNLSTFSAQENSIPLRQGITWLAVWDLNADHGVDFLKEFDLELKKGVLSAGRSFAVIVVKEGQKKQLAQIVDQNEFSFKILIDDKGELPKALWSWMPKPALLAVNPSGRIIWAGPPARAPREDEIHSLNE